MPGADPPAVHVLVVHGVGRHDRLSNLLRTYQTLRANLTSFEAPVTFEDQIPGWRLTRFEEGASPPFLKLEPRVAPPAGALGAAYLYEVNYSGFAGIVRQNHPIDLTTLFVGLDLAICEARQRPGPSAPAPGIGTDTASLARSLQRISGTLTASTVPIVGLPSIIFRDYIGTFVSTFTRFFEDVSTFALDKNGERLISSHLDRTMATIATAMKPGDRLVVAAHSLGSVVVHNYIVRSWAASTPAPVPDTLITFGSPIGLIMWLWLFLDFSRMNPADKIRGSEAYFSWNPVSRDPGQRSMMQWINVVNCVDPIATSFPDDLVDLSVTRQQIRAGLRGGTVAHRFLGKATWTQVGAAHSEYLNDKQGFIAILLRAAGMDPSPPEAVSDARTRDEHRKATLSLLGWVQLGLFAIALVAVAAYCFLVGRAFHDVRTVWFAAAFVWPALTIGVLAFFQRLMFGGQTKRIAPAILSRLHWFDLASFPYRVRLAVATVLGRTGDIDPMKPGPGRLIRTLATVVSFGPTLALMSVPVAGAAWLTDHWPSWSEIWSRLWTFSSLLALVAFMAYVVACAGFEFVRTWREVVRHLATPDRDTHEAPAQPV